MLTNKWSGASVANGPAKLAGAAGGGGVGSSSEELLEIDLTCTPGEPIGVQFLHGRLALPRGATAGLFVRSVDRRAGAQQLLEEGDFVLAVNGQELRSLATEGAALDTIRRCYQQAAARTAASGGGGGSGGVCRLRILRSDFVRSEFLNCLVRSLNGGGRAAPPVAMATATAGRQQRQPQRPRPVAAAAMPTQQQQQHQHQLTLSAGARIPVAKLEQALSRLGYVMSRPELARLRAAVGGSASVPFGRFVAAVGDILGARESAAVDDADFVDGDGSLVTTAAADEDTGDEAAAARDKFHFPNDSPPDEAPLVKAAKAARVSAPAPAPLLPRATVDAATATATRRRLVDSGTQTTATTDAAEAEAEAAAARAECRRLADLCAVAQRRLDETTAAAERDRRRLAVLAGEARKAGRHGNRLATALQAALDLLGRAALDAGEREEADAVAAAAAAAVAKDDAADREASAGLPFGWEAAEVEGGGVFVDHETGRVTREPPSPPQQLPSQSQPATIPPRLLNRYRMDILDRNGVPVRQIAL